MALIRCLKGDAFFGTKNYFKLSAIRLVNISNKGYY